jgi:YidC/Oxa1 family membrane protein insertase
VIPLYRRQLVSQRRMQMLQPEIKEIQRRYKGDGVKARIAQQELFKERGISPLAGCLPCSCSCPCCSSCTRSSERTDQREPDGDARGRRRAGRAPDLQQHQPATGQPDAALGPCIDTIIPFSAPIDVSQPSTIFSIHDRRLRARDQHPGDRRRACQLVQSRMMLPQTKPADDDPNTRIQRQTMLLLPLISVAYGGFLPAGLFIYWITATSTRSSSST